MTLNLILIELAPFVFVNVVSWPCTLKLRNAYDVLRELEDVLL